MAYRYYYDKDLTFLISEEIKYNPIYIAKRRAKQRRRMYANLFCRDNRPLMIKENSSCTMCGSHVKLVIDHIIPINKGGRNVVENLQILCQKCNRLKSDKTI